MRADYDELVCQNPAQLLPAYKLYVRRTAAAYTIQEARVLLQEAVSLGLTSSELVAKPADTRAAEQLGARADALSAELRVELAADDDALGGLLRGSSGGQAAPPAAPAATFADTEGTALAGSHASAMAAFAADFPLAPLDELGAAEMGFGGGATDEFGLEIQDVE